MLRILTSLALLPGLSMAASSAVDLVATVRRDDYAAVQTLLAHHANPNQILADGSTPLAWAVDGQDPQMVRLLLSRGAKPSATGGTEVKPLMIACQHGDAAILDMLLTAGATVRIARADGITPLALCAGNTTAVIVKRLLDAGAPVDQADHTGQTPLMWAAANGRVDNVKLLVEHGASINRASNKGLTPLLFALKSGNPQTPVAVLAAGGDADYIAPDGTSAVQLAMYQQDYAFAARLIERGASLTAFDRNGNQLLHAAVLANQPDLVKLLVMKGADANALTGTSKVTKRFEVNFTSAKYEVPPKPPLLLAAENGFADVMQVLVEAGANKNSRLSDGTNIVLAAAASGTLSALALALQLEPDANAVTATGETPLHVLLSGNAGPETGAMMKLLAAKGARTDLKNQAGKTPAEIAQDALTDVKAAYQASFLTPAPSHL